jgi:hypothetical protein
VQRQLGYCYEVATKVGHYQWVCPACRRALLGLAQGGLWHAAAEAPAEALSPVTVS